ncbi:MAG: fructose-6-phosphate aldolase [Bacteroidota bacterium]
MYILKIKGKSKITDYVQFSDHNFTLLAYFRVDRPEKALVKCGLGDREQQMIEMIREMPFGKVIKLDFDTTK